MNMPTHPIALRREYLNVSGTVARSLKPSTEEVALLLALTECLLRDLCAEPELQLRMVLPGDAESEG